MTIAVGLLCRDGVIVGADREVSYSTLKTEQAKTHVLELREGLRVSLAGAGSQDLITKAAQTLNDRLCDSMNQSDVFSELERLAEEIQTKHIAPNPQLSHRLDLMVGIKTVENGRADFQLVKVAGTIVVRVDGYDAVGYGSEVAHYVLHALYRKRENLSLSGASFLTAHVLKQAKTYSQYCGGQSDIAVLAAGLDAKLLSEADVLQHEQNSAKFAEIMRPVMLGINDLDVEDAELDQTIGKMRTELHAFRSVAFMQKQNEAGRTGERRLSIHDRDETSSVTPPHR